MDDGLFLQSPVGMAVLGFVLGLAAALMFSGPRPPVQPTTIVIERERDYSNGLGCASEMVLIVFVIIGLVILAASGAS